MRPECDLSGNICAIIGSIFQCWSCGSVHVDASWAVIPMRCDQFQGSCMQQAQCPMCLGKSCLEASSRLALTTTGVCKGLMNCASRAGKRGRRPRRCCIQPEGSWRVITAIQKVAGAVHLNAQPEVKSILVELHGNAIVINYVEDRLLAWYVRIAVHCMLTAPAKKAKEGADHVAGKYMECKLQEPVDDVQYTRQF